MSPLHSHREPRAQFVSTHCINMFSIHFFVSLPLKEITIFEEKGVRRIYWTRVRSFCLPFLLADRLTLIDVTLAFEDAKLKLLNVILICVILKLLFAIFWVMDIVLYDSLGLDCCTYLGTYFGKNTQPLGLFLLCLGQCLVSLATMIIFTQKHKYRIIIKIWPTSMSTEY